MILQRGSVAINDVIPGQQVVDPNLPGIYSIQDALQLSGLTVALATVGQAVQVVFTATNAGSGTFLGLAGGAVENACDGITGLVATRAGIVVAKLTTVQVCVGPYGSALPTGEYKAVALRSVGALPAQYAGSSLGGASVNAYVGPASEMQAYNVGDTFTPDLQTMLSATVMVTGTAPPFPGGGDNPPPPPGGTPPGGTPPGGTPPPPGTIGQTPTTGGLTSTEKAIAVVAGVVVLGGVVWLVTAQDPVPSAPWAASMRPVGRKRAYVEGRGHRFSATQDRQHRHIMASLEAEGYGKDEADRRAWATIVAHEHA